MSNENLMEACHQWASRPQDQRFQTLADLKAAVGERRSRSKATDVFADRISADITPGGLLTLNHELQPCQPTHWAFGQLAQMIKAPADYLRRMTGEPELLTRNINFGLANNTSKEQLKFMTVAPEDPTSAPAELRAINAVTYGRIWDYECCEAVERIVDASGGKFHNPLAYAAGQFGGTATAPAGLYASDHDVFMFMIDGGSRLEVGRTAAGKDDTLNRGFMMWNSETGARSFGLMTFFFRECCGNHIIWGAQDVNKLIIRHTSGGPGRFDNEAIATLKGYVDADPAPDLAVIRAAKDMLLPWDANLSGEDLKKAACDWGKRHGFSRSEILNGMHTARAEEGDCRTLWQMVQGLTAHARGFEWTDTRVDLEKRAGKLLDLARAKAPTAPVTVAV